MDSFSQSIYHKMTLREQNYHRRRKLIKKIRIVARGFNAGRIEGIHFGSALLACCESFEVTEEAFNAIKTSTKCG